jgi:hypothetical protein
MAKKPIIDEIKSAPEAQAARVKRVRNLANLERIEMCNDGSININTLKGWERGRYGGLSKVGAKKIVARVLQEGVICTPEWLLYEIGEGPRLIANFDKVKAPIEPNSIISPAKDDEFITEELLLFRKHYPNALDLKIADDGMAPYFQLGDVVAGIRCQGDDVNQLIGAIVIAHVVDGRILLRRLQAGNKPGRYILHCLNATTRVLEPVIYNVELISAAAVIWHRRTKQNGG